MRMAAHYGQDHKEPYSDNGKEIPDYLQLKKL